MDYVETLENRLSARSNHLEELHMEAAIDAELTLVANPNSSDGGRGDNSPIFEDYSNPHSVRNCLSPYVPSKADRLQAFFKLLGATETSHKAEVLLDLGCGDGRVCIAAAKILGCRSIGLDISPPCIKMAQDIAQEELQENNGKCSFYACDATIDPDKLLLDCNDSLARDLRSATIVYLYTYPTLLQKLVPLLQRLSHNHSLRKVVTLTYHLDQSVAKAIEVDETNDIRLYGQVGKL
ncbi:hypothetical protein ACA910_001701 [Epithemia clementina (nom. ined.)]